MHNDLWSQHHILSTKLRIPTLASGVVERPRLYVLLDQALSRPLTMLSAPPGFGKTTLVADWLQRRQPELPCAWVSLTQHDNQISSFWRYIFAAVDRAGLDTTDQLALLQTSQRSGFEAALIRWLNMLDKRAEPLVVVIDNYQYITSSEINEVFAFVVEHLPKHVHVILLTNHDPQLPLPRWHARGVISEIHAIELSYTTDEANAFLAANEPHCSSDEIDSVARHAEGWFAGLRLLSAAWKQANHISPVLAEASGSYVCEYVQHEVLADLPVEIRSFLLHTCVVDEVCAELCDALLDTGESNRTLSQHMLRTLERRNLFLVPLDRSRRWYRYHRLFREALRYLVMQEEPALFKQVSQRASKWYESHKQRDVRQVAATSPFNDAPALSTNQHLWKDSSIEALSAREHEVLALIAKGASNNEIADALTLSLHTVKRHASNILAKLNAANRTQAVAYARASGFLSAEPAMSGALRT